MSGGIFGQFAVGGLGSPYDIDYKRACPPAYWECNEQCWTEANGDELRAVQCVRGVCIPLHCPQAEVPETTPGTPPAKQEETALVAGKPCTSPEVIAAVQKAIGTTPDGKWGPQSQAALQRAGKTFKDFAQDCTGNPPSWGGVYGGGGGGGGAGGGTRTSYDVDVGRKDASVETSPFSFDSLKSKPIVWVGLALAAVGVYALVSQDDTRAYSRNPKKRPKMKIVQISTPSSRKKAKAKKSKSRKGACQ